MRRLLVVVWLALALPSLAGAQASFTAQQRSVEATSHSSGNLWATGTNPFFPDFDGPSATYTANHADDALAPAFGSFSETATSDAPLLQGFIGPAASASGSQTSSLAPQLITASGSFAADSDSFTLSQQELDLINLFLEPPIPYNFGIVGGDENGGSSFSVSFTLAQPTPYHLVASVDISEGVLVEGVIPITNGVASIELTGPSGPVQALSVLNWGGPYSDSVDATGVLPAGSYTLTADASGSAQGTCTEVNIFACYTSSTTGSFDLSLSLDTPPAVPGPSRLAAALLGVALAAIGAAALRRARA